MILDIIKSSFGILGTIVKGKIEVKQAETNAKVKHIEHADNWESIQAKASATSWKDEYLTLLFSIPLVLAFIPSMAQYVEQGFSILENVPEWYKLSLGVIVSASFGFRIANKFVKK